MRALVIEDESDIREGIVEGLKQEGYAVDEAADGELGFKRAFSDEYDVIILDLRLPKMDGITVCKKLRDCKIDTPILMLTALDSVEDKVKGLNTGADDYVSKPFSFEELLARTKALVRRRYHNINEILRVDSLEVDTNARSVSRSGKQIKLTAKEYMVLEYLMYNHGQIVTRDQILSHAWDYDYDSFSNIVDVMIKRLRDKIDRAFQGEKTLLKTVKGLGYLISDK